MEDDKIEISKSFLGPLSKNILSINNPYSHTSVVHVSACNGEWGSSECSRIQQDMAVLDAILYLSVPSNDVFYFEGQ